MRLVGVARGARCSAGRRKSTATRSHEGRAGVPSAQNRAFKPYAKPSRPAQAARLREPHVVVGGRGDADGGKSSRRPIRAATTAARAPRSALPPWRRGKSGAATPSACGRAAPGGRRRRRQRRGASAGAALGRGGAVARFSVLCGGAAGSSAEQSAAVLPEGCGAAPSLSFAVGGQFSPTSPGACPSLVSHAVGRVGCATAWPSLLG